VTIRAPALARLITALALVAGLVVGGAVAPQATRAATPDLTLVTAATYNVQPSAGKVAIGVAITATNHLTDTVTKHYFFRTAYLTVLPGTSNFKISTSSGSPHVSVAKRTSAYVLLKLDLGSNLGSGASRKLALSFDLKDPGGAPDRPIRISPSLVSFYAWAFATPSTPGSSVSVLFPAGYNVVVGRGPLTGPTTEPDGRLRWSSGSLSTPLTFIADLSADRPGDYVDAQRTIEIGDASATIVLRAWPDDPAWRDRVGDLLGRGLPVLGDSIGVAWPLSEPVIVQEALVRNTGGYAGLFDPGANRIEISYAAQPGVVLHEAAHCWFNGRLVADRWAAEAFASYYAEVAAAALKTKIASPELTDAMQANAVPLNAWGPVGTEPTETETYGYAASLALARAIAERAGAADMQRVWNLAAAHIGAYQPPVGGPELVTQAPDWRGLLDLLEESTGRSFDDLWRTWVVRPEDVPALEARDAARHAYDALLGNAGQWQLPAAIRQAMRTWQFEAADQLMNDAQTILRQRGALEREAALAGLQLPASVRTAFEAGDLPTASAEASAELGTIGAIDAAADDRPAAPTILERLGLLGLDPDTDLVAARSAFSSGDLDTAIQRATSAQDAWTGATGVGRGRIVSAVLLLAALALLVGLVLGRRRRPGWGRR
jgi:hypothetical protein